MTKDQFKIIRARLGLTQSQLAEKLGVSSKAVQSWEQGWRPVPGPVEKLMEIFSKESGTGRIGKLKNNSLLN